MYYNTSITLKGSFFLQKPHNFILKYCYILLTETFQRNIYILKLLCGFCKIKFNFALLLTTKNYWLQHNQYEIQNYKLYLAQPLLLDKKSLIRPTFTVWAILYSPLNNLHLYLYNKLYMTENASEIYLVNITRNRLRE